MASSPAATSSSRFRGIGERDLRRAIGRSARRGLILERRDPEGRGFLAVSSEGWDLLRRCAPDPAGARRRKPSSRVRPVTSSTRRTWARGFQIAERTAFGGKRLAAADQHRDPGRVEELAGGEVDDHPPGPLGAVDRRLDLLGDGEVELTGDGDDADAVLEVDLLDPEPMRHVAPQLRMNVVGEARIV